jgi:DNA-binding transcriptional LysR family regulator
MREALRQSGMGTAPINLCNNVRTIIDILAAGGGVALAPTAMAEEALRTGVLTTLPDMVPPPSLPFNVAVRASETDTLVQDVFHRAEALSIT